MYVPATPNMETPETILIYLRIRSNGANGNEDKASDYVLPPLSLHSLARSGAGEPGGIDGDVASRTASWSTQNPHAGGPASWDGTSAAAHQLVGLSQEQSVRSSLQHERPVPLHPLRKVAASQPMCNALDLDDLQNFLSWDMYGIMEMGGSVSNEDMDDSVSQSWTGAI